MIFILVNEIHNHVMIFTTIFVGSDKRGFG